jgi:hypothetical protein
MYKLGWDKILIARKNTYNIAPSSEALPSMVFLIRILPGLLLMLIMISGQGIPT